MVSAPSSKRRWFQFSFRTLLVLSVLAGCFLAWKKNRVEQQRKLLHLVEELHGSVYFDYQIKGQDEITIDANAKPSSPAWLRSTFGEDYFRNAAFVSLNNECTDEHAKIIGRVPSLQVVSVSNSKITDDAMKEFSRLPRLRKLSIMGTEVTDQGMAHIQTQSMEELLLLNTQITDEALSSIGKLRNLRELAFSNAATERVFTDQGIAHLRNLTKLGRLDASGTCVTAKGLKTIGSLSNLSELLIYGAYSGNDLHHLARLHKVQKLEVQVGDDMAAVQHLADLESLVSLEFSSTDRDASKLIPLENAPSLQWVVWYCGETYPDLRPLAGHFFKKQLIVQRDDRLQSFVEDGKVIMQYSPMETLKNAVQGESN